MQVAMMMSREEITKKMHESGYVLDLFQQEEEAALYPIYREVVDSGMQFLYECNSREEFHRQFFAPKSQVYVCRSLTGVVVGGFFVRPNFSGRSSHIANAAYMLQGASRGHGLGTLMVKASLHIAKDLGFRSMQYNMVLSQNTVAINLYKKLGFHVAGTLPGAVRNSDKTYQDGYIMFRSLDDVA